MNSRILLVLLVVLTIPATYAGERFSVGWRHHQAGEFDRALEHWRAAAGDGHAGAQLNLGLLYDFGQGVTPDATLAAHWYASAARQGSSAAQANLGSLYAAGRGVPRDLAAAAYWYRAAADQGLAFAQYQLGMLYARGTGVAADFVEARAWLRKSAAQGDVAAADALRTMAPAKLEQRAFWDGASLGSGWPVSAGLVITNHHVVEGSREIVLIDSRGREIAAQLVLSNRADDLALLRVADASALPPTLPLAVADAAAGSEVFALGYPRIDELGHSPKLSAGFIGVNAAAGGGPRTYRLDLNIEPGYSGGPLLNARGEVVGTVTGMLGLVDDENRLTHLMHNASVAVKLSTIRETLARISAVSALESQRHTDAHEPVDVARIGASVLVVVAR